MSVPDIVRNVTKSVRDKFSEQEEVKDKAKGLPLYVIRQALTGVGQALLFGNRLRNRLVGGDGKDGEEKTDAKAEITTTVTPEETKPARREPVIFAPRPGTNGTNPETEAVAETKTAEVTVESTEPAPAESAEVVEPADPKAEAKVTAEAEDAADAENNAGTEEAEDSAHIEDVKDAADTKDVQVIADAGDTTAATHAKDPETADTSSTDAASAGVENAQGAIAATDAEDAERAESNSTATADIKSTTDAEAPVIATEVPAEPMPGYAGLTVASLRARMRGKSAEQIRELLAYEEATSARETVLKMYRNRLAKLEVGGGA